jgi:hypothetical protein
VTPRIIFSSVLLICGTLCVAGALALASYVAHESAKLQGQHAELLASMAGRGIAALAPGGGWAYERTANYLTWTALVIGIALLWTGLRQGMAAVHGADAAP